MYIIVGVILAAVTLVIAISYIFFKSIFVGRKKPFENAYKGLEGDIGGVKKLRREFIERTLEIPCLSVTVTARDGKKLHGRYYHTKDGAPLLIFFHGYKSMWVRDFSGIIGECIRLGYNLIVADGRAHGESEGSIISFGIIERMDVLSFCEYAEEKFGPDTKIILYGMSMGGASVLMASELNLPRVVVGIIADCPFSSPKEMLKKVLRDKGLFPAVAYPILRLGAILFGRFDPSSASAVDAVSSTDLPILIFHGENDRLVPCHMSEKILENARTAKLVKIKDATHCTSFLYDEKNYTEALESFIDRITK